MTGSGATAPRGQAVHARPQAHGLPDGGGRHDKPPAGAMRPRTRLGCRGFRLNRRVASASFCARPHDAARDPCCSELDARRAVTEAAGPRRQPLRVGDPTCLARMTTSAVDICGIAAKPIPVRDLIVCRHRRHQAAPFALRVCVNFVGDQDHLRGIAGQESSSECVLHSDEGARPLIALPHYMGT